MCRSKWSALALAAGLAACAARIVAAQTAMGNPLVAQGALNYVFYCAACHGGTGEGDPAAHVPQLAGRSAASLVREISALRQAARTGRSAGKADAANASAGKGNHARVFAQLNAKQIEGIAQYLARLAPPPAAAQ